MDNENRREYAKQAAEQFPMVKTAAPIAELTRLLDYQNIPFDLMEAGGWMGLKIPTAWKPKISVVCFPGSYGFPENLELAEFKKNGNVKEPKGWLSPQEALELIKKGMDA